MLPRLLSHHDSGHMCDWSSNVQLIIAVPCLSKYSRGREPRVTLPPSRVAQSMPNNRQAWFFDDIIIVRKPHYMRRSQMTDGARANL